MHPLCCIQPESPATGDQSPEPRMNVSRSCSAVDMRREGNAVGWTSSGSESCFGSRSFAGVLYKWTNYGKGWRSRWFLLRNGLISYSKLLQPDTLGIGEELIFIGDVSGGVNRLDRCGSRRRYEHQKTVGIVHFQVLSFRESNSDEKKFYIYTAIKTLYLTTSSKKDRVAWIEALASTKNLSLTQLNDKPSKIQPTDISLCTERLKKRLLQDETSEVLVKDCGQIMLLEVSKIQEKPRILCEERANLLQNMRHLVATSIDGEAYEVPDGPYQLAREEVSDLGRGKFSQWSTSESSDDVEKQEPDQEEDSEDEEIYFFDTQDYFPELKTQPVELAKCEIERRKKLPDPAEKEKPVSLWSMIKDNVGKDLTRVCLPVYFNEPISSLQKCFEDLEYSSLLDQAYHHGIEGNSLQRMLNVAAFAVSGYASSDGRHCKPFNPLLGETYEADYPEKGIRFFSEKVSHHPTILACHTEGKGWKFYGDCNIVTKFWGQSIQIDPVGVLTLEFDDGEVFQWSKVTTSIHNLIFGKVYCEHHGMMHIRGNREYSCQLKFKEQSFLERNPRQSRNLQENGWKPRWFEKDGENGTYRYVGGYWKTREERGWDGWPNIFGELSQEIIDSTSRP